MGGIRIRGRGSVPEIPQISGDRSVGIVAPGRTEIDRQRDVATTAARGSHRYRPLISADPEEIVADAIGRKRRWLRMIEPVIQSMPRDPATLGCTSPAGESEKANPCGSLIFPDALIRMANMSPVHQADRA